MNGAPALAEGGAALRRCAAGRVGLDAGFVPDDPMRILRRLRKAGYEAHLVGGCVRDRLLGVEPTDFDIATDAHPEEAAELFRRARVIGRRFRLVHVRAARRQVIEVSTFRALHSPDDAEAVTDAGRVRRNNVYGDLESDLERRDFTVNAMYYDPLAGTLTHHAHALRDLRARRLRTIGDPAVRFREDPVRILRAVRFAARLGFAMAQSMAAEARRNAKLLQRESPARLFDETVKLFHGGAARAALPQLIDYGLLKALFPEADRHLKKNEAYLQLLLDLLENTDRRVAAGQPVTPAFVYAGLFWPEAEARAAAFAARGDSPAIAIHKASKAAFERSERVSVPRRHAVMSREIHCLQRRFLMSRRASVKSLLKHRRFRAAYDFFCMRAQAGMADKRLAEWWTRVQEVDDAERGRLIGELVGRRGQL